MQLSWSHLAPGEWERLTSTGSPHRRGQCQGTLLSHPLLHRADGFRCLADIMVATPGRLVDHVDQTPGFSLQHLRFLVGHHLEGGPGRELKLTLVSCLLQIIDEADRMIDSMHQSWLPRVVAAAFPSEGPKDPCALLQRTQPRVVTAARYPALRSLCSQPSGAALSWSLELSTLAGGAAGWAVAVFPVPHSLSACAVPRCPCRSYSSQPP